MAVELAVSVIGPAVLDARTTTSARPLKSLRRLPT
jgi:hypothetical protein